MLKIKSLRETMTAALKRHGVDRNPADLFITVPTGSVSALSRLGLSFEYRFTVVVAVLDFAGAVDELIIPALLWVRRWQPDLLTHGAAGDGFSWEIDLLDEAKSDIMIRLDLTEAVALTPRSDGGFDITHREDPAPFALDEAEPLHGVWLDGERIARCAVHPEA